MLIKLMMLTVVVFVSYMQYKICEDAKAENRRKREERKKKRG